MSTKTIIGRVGNKSISETIENFNPNIPEQILTAKRNICRKFESLGIRNEYIIFNERQ